MNDRKTVTDFISLSGLRLGEARLDERLDDARAHLRPPGPVEDEKVPGRERRRQRMIAQRGRRRLVAALGGRERGGLLDLRHERVVALGGRLGAYVLAGRDLEIPRAVLGAVDDLPRVREVLGLDVLVLL